MKQIKACWRRLLELLRSHHLGLPVFFSELLLLALVFQKYNYVESLTALHDPVPFLFTFCWCVLLTAIAALLPSVVSKVYVVAATAVYGILVLVHCGMYSFFGKFYSWSDIQFAGDGAAFFKLEYIYIRKIVIFTVILCIFLSFLASKAIARQKYSKGRFFLSVLMIALAILGVNQTKRLLSEDSLFMSWDNYKRKNSIYENFTNTNEALMLTGLYQYTFRDFCLSYDVYNRLGGMGGTVAELDEYYAEKTPDPDNEMTGIYEGKNLILIQLEAIDTWLINDICMPNLTEIQKNSINFENHYAPMYLSAGTFNSENIVNTGLVSPFINNATAIYTRNYYPDSAAHLFRDAGYSANSFHNSRGQVYDRETIHLNWGYEQYHSGDSIGMEDIDLDRYLMSGYDLMVSKDHSFFTFIITYSGHGAYEGSKESEMYYDQFAAQLPAGTDPMVIHAYAHAYETDLFIGELMERLEADGYLENTVLAFYADHYDYYVLDDGIIMDQKQVYDGNLIQHTPFFIYSKDTAPRTVSKVTSTIDVLPTLANLFRLDTDGRYYIGNDAFSDGGGYVIFKDYSWFDGTTYWNSMADSEDSPEIAARNAEIQKRLQVSWDTMTSNYFKVSSEYTK